jgi:hypothetical protein
MKNNLILVLCSLLLTGAANAQNFGIGTNMPTNKLHVKPTTGINDPVRFENLKNGAGGDSVLVTTTTGVVRQLDPKNFMKVNGLVWPYHTSDLTIGTPGNGKGIIALPGNGQVASGSYSHSEGVSTLAKGDFNWALMQNNNVNGDHNFVIGTSNTIPNTATRNYLTSNHNIVSGVGNIVNSFATLVNGNSNKVTDGYAGIIVGENNESKADFSMLFGSGNQSRGGLSAISFGVGAYNILEDGLGYAIGTSNVIWSNGSQFAFAVGDNNKVGTTNGRAAIAIGTGNTSNGEQGISIGTGNITATSYTGSRAQIAIGEGNDARGTGSIAIGFGNKAYATLVNRGNAVSIGDNNTVNISGKGFAFGSDCYVGATPTTFGQRAMALGFGAVTGHERSIAIGVNVVNTTGENQIVMRAHGVTGTSSAYVFYTNPSSTTIGVELTANATSWTSLSDRTTKENIKSNNYGLKEVMQLGTYSYNYIGTNANDRRVGIMAQEVKQLMPELVPQLSSGKLGVNYTELIPVLIKAIQEQQLKIEQLEKKLAQLK